MEGTEGLEGTTCNVSDYRRQGFQIQLEMEICYYVI